MRLIACYSIYNEEFFLKKSLDTVDGKVDLIVFVDGAYQGYDPPHSASTDKTLEIITAYPFTSQVKFIPAPEQPWQTQMQKRSRYFIGKNSDDWYLIIDADETVEYGLDDKLRNVLWHTPHTIDGYIVKVETPAPNDQLGSHWNIRPHLVRHREGIHYEYNHTYLVDGNGRRIISFGDYPHMLIRHWGYLRPQRKAMTALHMQTGRGESSP